MKKTVIGLLTLSICYGIDNLPANLKNLKNTLQKNYQVYSLDDLYKLKKFSEPSHRIASRDMEDLVGEWKLEEEWMELFVTVASDQTIVNPYTMMAILEAEGGVTATDDDFQTELTYLLDTSYMDEDGGGDSDCDMNCMGEYNDYMDDGIDVSDEYCDCCHEDYPIDEICEEGVGANGVEFEYESVADLYGNYGSILETVGADCDGCMGNFDGMDAVTSFDIASSAEFENWANNYEFSEYYFQFIDENDDEVYDSGEIYAISCEGDDIAMTVAYDGSVYELSYENFWMEAYNFYWGDGDDDDPREDTSRNYDALTFAQDYVNDNSSDWGEDAFDLESEFDLVVDGEYVSGGLGGNDPAMCEINWPEDPFKMAVYSFVSEYVLIEGGSIGCFLDNSDLDQTYASFVMEMENEWNGGGDDDDEVPTPEDFLDWCDANGDSVLTLEEIINGINDINSESGDPPLSEEEEDYLEYAFNESDENDDGVLDLDELENFIYILYNDDEDEEDERDELFIMNISFMEFFMLMFGLDPDSLGLENPVIVAVFTNQTESGDIVIDEVQGLYFADGEMLQIVADSAEIGTLTNVDTTQYTLTFNNLNLYEENGSAVVLSLSGTIGPGWIDFLANEETAYPFLEDMFGEDDAPDAFMSFYDDSTGMEIYVEEDDYYYYSTYADTSYFTWYATSDSLFLYHEYDDYYYEEEADTTELAYYFMNDGTDTLAMEASFDPCEDEGSIEECIEDASDEIAGLNELEDIESLRISFGRTLTPGSYTAIDSENGTLPKEFNLYANYPNPFNPVTTIRFDVGQNTANNTILRIYDITGRSIATLIDGQLQTGTYEVQWDAKGFASGIYFSELVSGSSRKTQKMVLLK